MWHTMTCDNVSLDVDTSKPLLFDKLTCFLNSIPQTFSDPGKQKSWELFGKTFDDLLREIESLKDLTAGCGNLACGFTHNDLLLENVIYNEGKGKVSFIDYEYGGYNYLYFDIGDHFAEHAGVEEVDHSLYPDNAYRKQWLSVYMLESRRLRGDNSSAPISDEKLEEASNLVNLFALWSHLFWGAWALVQAEHSTVPFDYVDYGKSRLGAYFGFKREFTKFLVDPKN